MKNPKSVQRPFTLTSPTHIGEDVTEFQEAVNEKFDHFNIDRSIVVDGETGPQTIDAGKQIAFCMGAGRKNLAALKEGRISESVQRLVRGQREKTRWEKVLTNARGRFRKKLQKRYDKTAGEKAIERSERWVGTEEEPNGSNWGGWVEKFIRFTGYSGPVFWCGCWACWVVVKLGGAKIPNRIRLGSAWLIEADARAHTNGLIAISAEQVRAGDIGCAFNNEHIVTFRGPFKNGVAPTREGNTSPGDEGSQSNGGCVADKTRNVSDFNCFARPNYA